MNAVPSFAPRIDRTPLGPELAKIDLAGCGTLAAAGQGFVAFAERVDSMIAGWEHDLLVLVGADLDAAFARGLALAREAVEYSSAATHMLAVAPAPRPPSLAVLRAHIAEAERAANAKLDRRLGVLRRNAAAERGAVLGQWREAIDRARSLDPAERETAEAAYSRAAVIDLELCWPVVRFQELRPVHHEGLQ